MSPDRSIDELWKTPAHQASAEPPSRSELPAAAARWLFRALGGRTTLPVAVRLRMHGEIRIGSWSRFDAEQVIHRDRGMIWRARARRGPFVVSGFDRIVDGVGEMRWKLFGLAPVMTGRGPDVTRSAAGRLAAESIWLPSLLCGPGIDWSAVDDAIARVRLEAQGFPAELELRVDPEGRLASVASSRWGNPGGGAFREEPFGALIEEEATWDGVTVPSRVRVGWGFDGERFAGKGEFFRATIDTALFR